MNQEIFRKRNSTQSTRSSLGCKQWWIIIIIIILSPIWVFLLDIFVRKAVIPWGESIVVNLHQDQVDRSFITGQPCQAPCWYNLYLGVSSGEELKGTLKQLPFVDQNHIKEWDITWQEQNDAKEILYDCSYLADHSCGGIVLYRDRFMQIWTRVDYRLTFETVVERLGSPDYYALRPGIEFANCDISLFWVENNLELVASNNQYSGCPFELGIDPRLWVNTLAYSLENVANRFEKYSDVYHPWRGFLEP